MPARTGPEYIKGLQEQEREVWLRGERVKDVTGASWVVERRARRCRALRPAVTTPGCTMR